MEYLFYVKILSKIQDTHFVEAKNRKNVKYVQIKTRYDEIGRLLSVTFKVALIISY